MKAQPIWMHIMLGPLMLVLALLFKLLPPKKINHWYGYRTPRSMRSQQAWRWANRYSANAMVVVAALTCLVQMATHLLINFRTSIVWSAIFLSVALITVIPLTEVQLKRRGFK